MEKTTTYSRHIKTRLLEILGGSPSVLLYGPRQCGKTTLAKDVAATNGYSYISLDDKSSRDSALSDPTGFVDNLPSRAILDEVQRVPDLFWTLKAEIDNNYVPGRFLLTSSASPLLMPKIIDPLVGRVQNIRLHPLAQCEIDGSRPTFLDALFADGFSKKNRQRDLFDERGEREERQESPPGQAVSSAVPESPGSLRKKSQEDLLRRIMGGGFPRPVQYQSQARRIVWYRDYAKNQATREVRDFARIRNVKSVPLLLKLAAARTATLLNSSSLARELETNHVTVQGHLSLLEQMFLLKLLPPWRNNQPDRLTKTPKLHFADTGLACSLLGLHPQRLVRDTGLKGQIAETFALQELRRLASWHEEPLSFSHFRDKSNFEVDIVVEKADQVAGVEVKFGATVTGKDFRGLRRLAEITGKRFAGGMVLHSGTETFPFGKGMWAVPFSRLWTTA